MGDGFTPFPSTTMTITELLTAIRQPYADLLSQAARAQESYVEPAYRNNDGMLATEGIWDLPCRADVIRMSEDTTETVQVDSQTRLKFEPVHFHLADCAMELHPLVWDWLSLEVQGLPQEQAAQALADWFMDWFDGDDANEPDEAGLQQVVHFMSDPQVLAEGVGATIDLGSAPVEAVEDLLFALSDAGADRVRLA